MKERPHHIDIDRNFWLWAIGGIVFAAAVGALYAWYLMQAGEWNHGLPWEIELLRRVHVTLPQPLDFTLLSVPWLGTNITILPAVAIASWFLWKRGRKDLIIALVVAGVGNYIVGFFLKFAFERPRPDLWPPRGEFTGPSYPSGHAMMVTSFLFVVAYLLRREKDWTWPYYACLVFVLITSYSRLYLGVHWPTDVLGGTIVGTVWLSAMLRAMDAHADEVFEFERRSHPRTVA